MMKFNKKGFLDDFFDFLFMILAVFFLFFFFGLILFGNLEEQEKEVLYQLKEIEIKNDLLTFLKMPVTIDNKNYQVIDLVSLAGIEEGEEGRASAFRKKVEETLATKYLLEDYGSSVWRIEIYDEEEIAKMNQQPLFPPYTYRYRQGGRPCESPEDLIIRIPIKKVNQKEAELVFCMLKLYIKKELIR